MISANDANKLSSVVAHDMQLTGARQSALLKEPLWEVLRAPCDRDSASWRANCEVAAHRGEFFIHGVRLWGRPSGGAFALRFRCALVQTPASR